MNFGKILLELRKQKNITQEALAAELGVTAAAISKWENGNTLPDILMLCALADFFDITTDELLGRKAKTMSAVIAAETKELGQRIAALAEAYGITAQHIFTDFSEATNAAKQDASIRCIIAGFYTGWYSAQTQASVLVCVHPSDEEIMDAFKIVFEKYWDEDDHQFIIN